MKQLSIIIISIIVVLFSADLKADTAILKKLQETSHISYLIAKRFLQERTRARKKITCYNQNEKQLSIDDKIFENPTCEIHDITIYAKREECNDQEIIILTTRVFGTIDDFEYLDINETEEQLLKFVLIKAYKTNLEQYTKTKKRCVTIILDGNSKVTLQPTFVTTIKKGSFSWQDQEITSTDYKGMVLLTVFSKAEFDALVEHYFNA